MKLYIQLGTRNANNWQQYDSQSLDLIAPISWQIDYYDSGLPLVSYDNGTTTLADTPDEGVVFVWLRQMVGDKEFTVRCQGWDRYYLVEEEGGVRYGGWMDEGSPHGVGGRDFRWANGENSQTMTPITSKPDDIEENCIKVGGLVPRPDSITLGLE